MNDKYLPTPLSAASRIEIFVLWLFGGAFFLFLFVYGLRPIYDPDFWWHLKTGEVMAQTGGLLSSDPFTFTDDGMETARKVIILKGYWLWQLTTYGFFSLLGLNGIFLFNLLTVGAMAGVVMQQMLRQRVNYALTALLMTLGFYLFRATYALERPQVVSFLFAAILLAILARVRDGGRLGWTLPLLMVAWANLHGGFVVGDIILLCFAAGAVMEYRQDLPRLRHLLLWTVVGICASLLNPTGALVFAELLDFYDSALMTGINEYRNTLVTFQEGYRFIAILWVLIAFYCVGLCSSRRLFWPEFFVAIFLAYFSVVHLRNVGFFAIAMLPAIGFHLQLGVNRRQWQLPSFVAVLLLIFCATFLLWWAARLWEGRNEPGPFKTVCSENAIAFLQGSGLRGRMFNDILYGNYLLWRLGPETKVFIDGRTLVPKVFEDWQKISQGSSAWVAGRMEYEALLDSYAIDYIVQPIYNSDGIIQPLLKNLLYKPEWSLIYLDPTAYVLARLTPQNADVINVYRIDKSEIKAKLILLHNNTLQSPAREVNDLVARAMNLIYLGMYDEAKVHVEAIAAVSPNNRYLPALQLDLARLRIQRLRQ